jgi:hypothetical protein
MKVKVQRYVQASGYMKFGIYVKRWWLPIWIRVDYWDMEEIAIQKALVIKHPKITEIT